MNYKMIKSNTTNTYEELKPNFKEQYSSINKMRKPFNKLKRLFKKRLKNG